MKKGTKFRAIRRRTHKPAFKSKEYRNGRVLTCVDFVDGLITCAERTWPVEGREKTIQIFTKMYDIRFESESE